VLGLPLALGGVIARNATGFAALCVTAISARLCLLWVISGRGRMSDRCLLYSQKRTSVGIIAMSA
jgi:hypothetical protein